MASYQPARHLREADLNARGATALLFIDTQNYNCHRDGALYRGPDGAQADLQWWWQQVDATLPKWQQLQQEARAAGLEVMYTVIQQLTRDGRDRSLDYKISGFNVPPGCWDAAVCSEIAPARDEMVLPKTSSSVFMSTNIDYLLRNMGVKHLVLAGCVTDQCVGHAARDACDLGYLVTLVTDCCITYSHERQEQALSAVAGYCRQRTLHELTQELSGCGQAPG